MRQNRWYDFVKMSLGKTVTTTGGKNNVFNGWLYHKRC